MDTGHEYTLEELNNKIRELTKKDIAYHKALGYNITKFTIIAEGEYGYYDSFNTTFKIRYYREETDKEYEQRLRIEELTKAAKEKQRETLLKRQQEKLRKQKELEKDPDYIKLQELKKKFQGKL